MEQHDLEAPWLQMLEALPVPVALVDAEGVYHFLNSASAADPVLARGRVGRTDLECCAADEVLLERARRRHDRCAEVFRTNRPCMFEEPTAGAGAPYALWIYAPVAGVSGRKAGVVLLGLDLSAWQQRVAARVQHQVQRQVQQALSERLVEEVQIPLISMVSLFGSLARELTGPPGEQAALIDRNGQRVLQRLRLLLSEPDGLPSGGAGAAEAP